MEVKVSNINNNILKELEEKTPELWEQAEQKYPKIKKWLEGEDFPTYNQLTELSKIFHIPFGYFFLDKLPERKYPIPHYRTLQYADFVPSLDLIETVEFAQQIQSWARYILTEFGNAEIPFCGKYSTKNSVGEIVNKLVEIFGENYFGDTFSETFRNLVEIAEDNGIFVLINGVVGNNTRRKLDVTEFRGFVLYDPIAPVVFINNNDAISAKIFTLIHEVVHILIGKSASFDLRNLISADNEIEKFCDRCTAEFLVPERMLEKEYHQKDLDELANYFKVSKIVILRRLLDIGKINKQEFNDEFNQLYNYEHKQSVKQSGGGNFYYTVPYRLSKSFIGLLHNAVETNVVLFRDALRITGLNTKTYNNLIKETLLFI